MYNNQFNAKRKTCPEKQGMCSIYYSHFASVSVCLKFVGCSSLNTIGTSNLIQSGSIRKYGFVGMDMVLLEEVRHCRVGFETYAQDTAQC